MIIVACPCSQPGNLTQPRAYPGKPANPEYAGALEGHRPKESNVGKALKRCLRHLCLTLQSNCSRRLGSANGAALRERAGN
jgi:hypothetical protein